MRFFQFISSQIIKTKGVCVGYFEQAQIYTPLSSLRYRKYDYCMEEIEYKYIDR